MKEYYLISELADILGVSKETLRRWDNNGKLKAQRHLRITAPQSFMGWYLLSYHQIQIFHVEPNRRLYVQIINAIAFTLSKSLDGF